jgi:hypothetical protein
LVPPDRNSELEDYIPISGKTYSLFGKNSTTQPFYQAVQALTSELLLWYPGNENDFLEYIKSVSHDRRALSRTSKNRIRGAKKHLITSNLSYTLDQAQEILSVFMGDVGNHIRSVPFRKRFSDNSLLTTREQYYLYMIEFELVNRICLKKFRDADFKLALLPYCLKETHTNCKAEPDELDYVCKSCRKSCYINRLSKILQDDGIHPYILSRGRVSKLLKGLRNKHNSVGVLGIACMVELIEGMRLCLKAELPVVGIPLNANRCPRWMETMHETSIDLAALHNLLKAVSPDIDN